MRAHTAYQNTKGQRPQKTRSTLKKEDSTAENEGHQMVVPTDLSEAPYGHFLVIFASFCNTRGELLRPTERRTVWLEAITIQCQGWKGLTGRCRRSWSIHFTQRE